MLIHVHLTFDLLNILHLPTKKKSPDDSKLPKVHQNLILKFINFSSAQPIFEKTSYRTQITEEDDRALPKRVLKVRDYFIKYSLQWVLCYSFVRVREVLWCWWCWKEREDNKLMMNFYNFKDYEWFSGFWIFCVDNKNIAVLYTDTNLRKFPTEIG